MWFTEGHSAPGTVGHIWGHFDFQISKVVLLAYGGEARGAAKNVRAEVGCILKYDGLLMNGLHGRERPDILRLPHLETGPPGTGQSHGAHTRFWAWWHIFDLSGKLSYVVDEISKEGHKSCATNYTLTGS